MSTPVASAFAVTAETMLSEQRFAEAVQLCARGVTEFPNYVGGYVMLAKAYEALGQHHDAAVMRTAAQERFPWYVPPVEAPQPTPQVVEPVHREQPSVLRMIDTAHLVNDERIIRSASVRLIPGLEYTSLRFENLRTRGRRDISFLSDPPPFRSFHTMRRTTRTTEPSREQRREPRKAVSLEEIASRLERRTRMPRATEETEHAPPPEPNGPMLMTETIARIYMQQGSYDRAIEAFRMLQLSKPDKHAQFEALIAECERARTS
jgi:tetratricopeptide (TPR) repeat protein